MMTIFRDIPFYASKRYKEIEQEKFKQMSIDRCNDVLTTLSKISNFSIKELTGETKEQKIVDVRLVYIYICHKLLLNPYIYMTVIKRHRTTYYKNLQSAETKIKMEAEMLRLYKQSCHELGIEP